MGLKYKKYLGVEMCINMKLKEQIIHWQIRLEIMISMTKELRNIPIKYVPTSMYLLSEKNVRLIYLTLVEPII